MHRTVVMTDVVKKAPAINNTAQMGVGAFSYAADKTGLIPGLRGVAHPNPLGKVLAPIALGTGMSGMYNSGTAMYNEGVGSLDQDGNSNAMNFLGATGATVAGGIGTAALGADIAMGLGATGSTVSSISTATTAGVATGSTGAGLATSVASAGALPVAAAVGGGLAAGVAIGTGINNLADSEYNPYMDEQGQNTADRWQQSIVDEAIANGEDPGSVWNVTKGTVAGMAGTIGNGVAAGANAVGSGLRGAWNWATDW